MIKRFTCRNFRNINAENLEFAKINILIGPNNSGKSNFIKALTFFSEMLKKNDSLIAQACPPTILQSVFKLYQDLLVYLVFVCSTSDLHTPNGS